jgi:hypothetical protein
MATFARLTDMNEVHEILVIDDSVILDSDGNIDESLGQNYINTILEGRYAPHTVWKMCCCEGKIRHRYPSIGWFYNEQYDAFVAPQPFPSWTFNEQTLDWDPPVPDPSPSLTEEEMLDGWVYVWDEYQQVWNKEHFPPMPPQE